MARFPWACPWEYVKQINEIKNLFNEVFIEAIGPNAPIIEKEIEGEKIYAYYSPNLAGFATIWEGDEIFLHFLFIKKSERRKRIGTALIKALLEYYKKPIKLKCLIKNKNALAFYKKLGAKECSFGESIDGPYVLLSIEKILDPTL